MSSTTLSDFPLADLVACAEREVKMRRQVYAGRITNGGMTQEEADLETAKMQAIAEHLRKLASAGPLFREVWARLTQLPADVVALLENGPSPRTVFDAEPNQCRALAVEQSAMWLRLAAKLPAPVAPAPAPAAPAPAADDAPLTAAQHEQITRLFNHPAITRKEKTALVLRLPKMKLTEFRHTVAQLQRTIDVQEAGVEVADLKQQLRELVQAHGEALAYPECERLLQLCTRPDTPADELRAEIAAVQQYLRNPVAA